MRTILVDVRPRPEATTVLAKSEAGEPLLRARLLPEPRHPRALPLLLEALALWQGATVHAALAAGAPVDSYDTSSSGLYVLVVGHDRRPEPRQLPLKLEVAR